MTIMLQRYYINRKATTTSKHKTLMMDMQTPDKIALIKILIQMVEKVASTNTKGPGFPNATLLQTFSARNNGHVYLQGNAYGNCIHIMWEDKHININKQLALEVLNMLNNSM